MPARLQYHYHSGKRGGPMRAFAEAHDRIADQNTVMLDLLYGANPITDDELRALIARRPELQRFSGYIGKR